MTQDSLDMRLGFSFNGTDYLVSHGIRQSGAEIELPDGTLLKVTQWGGGGIFPVIKAVVRLDQRTADTALATASVASKGSTGAPPGALN